MRTWTFRARGNRSRELDRNDAWTGPDLGLLPVTGTTTWAKDAIHALAQRHAIENGGYLETMAVLQREPDNAVDPNAIVVAVEGERIGYVPSGMNEYLQVEVGSGVPVPVQVFTELLDTGLRAEAFVWLSTAPAKWEWSKENPAPLSPEAKRMERHGRTVQSAKKARREGGERAEVYERGTVKGIHYLTAVEPIKQLKRENKLEEALELCYIAIDGAEGVRNDQAPAPWYTEQAAIIHRKLGQRDKEIAVLKRWLRLCPPHYRNTSTAAARLAKLQAK